MNRTDFIRGPLNGSGQPLPEMSTILCEYNITLIPGNGSRGNDTDDGMDALILTYICVVCYLLICVLGLLGNGLVIYVVLMYAKMKTVTNMYILNLALSDFFFLIMLPFLATNTILMHWPFGFAMCKIYFVVYSINLFGGVFNLLLMSADRYLAVCHPIRSVKYRTPRIALFICLCIWTVSFLVMLPVILYSTTGKHPHMVGKEYCSIQWPDNQLVSPDKAFIWYSFILGFAMPVSLISVFYLLVIIRLRHVGPAKKSKEKKKSHRRVTRLVLTVIAVYVMCWLPYWCFQVKMVFMEPDEGTVENQTANRIMMYILHSFTVLTYANSMLNPFLYAFLSDNFRKSFGKAFKCLPFSMDSSRSGGAENSVFPRTSQTGVGRTGVSHACEEKMEMTPFTPTNAHNNTEDCEQPHVLQENNRKTNRNEEEEEEEEDEEMLDRNGDENAEFIIKPVHL